MTTGQLAPTRIDAATGQPDPSIVGLPMLSTGDAWRGIRLDHVTLPAQEQATGYLKHHSVLVHLGEPVTVEASWPGEHESRTLRRGAILIVPASVPYRARWDRPWELLSLRLSVEAVASAAPEVGVPALRYMLGCEDPLLLDLVLALHKQAQRGPGGDDRYANSLGTAAIAHLVHEYRAAPGGDRLRRGGLPVRRLKQVQDYIERNVGQALHLERLAALAGASVRQFLRAFKESTGITPHQYVLLRRIERAKQLLVHEQMPVAEVAQRCGFASQSRFTAAFHRFTRATPGAWRKGSV